MGQLKSHCGNCITEKWWVKIPASLTSLLDNNMGLLVSRHWSRLLPSTPKRLAQVWTDPWDSGPVECGSCSFSKIDTASLYPVCPALAFTSGWPHLNPQITNCSLGQISCPSGAWDLRLGRLFAGIWLDVLVERQGSGEGYDPPHARFYSVSDFSLWLAVLLALCTCVFTCRCLLFVGSLVPSSVRPCIKIAPSQL